MYKEGNMPSYKFEGLQLTQSPLASQSQEKTTIKMNM